MASRVTNAELARMLQALDEKVEDIKENVEKINGRERTLENRMTAVETKQGIWGIGNAALAMIAATIAGWFGLQR